MQSEQVNGGDGKGKGAMMSKGKGKKGAEPRYFVRTYRTNPASGNVSEWFKVVDRATGKSVRTGLQLYRQALDIAADLDVAAADLKGKAPKNRTGYRALDILESDPRILEAWTENEPTAIWIRPAKGWTFDPGDAHNLHVETVREALAEYRRDLVQCFCAECGTVAK